MITRDLIEYIKSQLNKNFSKDIIVSQLLQVGWKIEDIEEGFSTIQTVQPNKIEEPTLKEEVNVDKKKVDLYRELPEENESIKVEQPKIWTPSTIESKVIENKPLDKIEKVEPVKLVEPVEPSKEVSEKIVFSDKKDLDSYKIEVGEGENKNKSSYIEFIPIINKTLLSDSSVEKVEKTELAPSLISKGAISLVGENLAVEKDKYKGDLPPLKIQIAPEHIVEKKMFDTMQKNAMITSYSQDILAAKKEEPVAPRKKFSFLKIGIIVFVLSLIGGMVFSFVEGYIKIPWLNINVGLVKKDPKTIMLNAPGTISKLKSYKVETNISISSPSLSNITTGLSSGDAVTSKEKDTLSVNTKGKVNHSDNKLFFDYLLSFKSSLLSNDINSNIKYNGKDLYVEVPNLSKILGDNAPSSTTVALKTNQITSIIPEFSTAVQNQIKNLDVYNILSGEIPTYVNTQTALIFKDFIGKLEYTEKADEIIHGVDTYHYELTAGRQLTKKFLTDLSDLFIVKITPEQKIKLEEALGSSTISSFEVWVGKNDDNLYQFKFTLNTPLSKVLGLNDSGIANNEVKLDWITTYYDLDVSNDIQLPTAEVDMNGFLNKIKDIKVKNIISSFKKDAVVFKNTTGSFGGRSNPAGSCANPNPGSIFSPQGHVKGADGSISSISEKMNSLLLVTNGAGSCYSTSGAWALSAPLLTKADQAQSNFYCIDNTGNETILLSPITGPACK